MTPDNPFGHDRQDDFTSSQNGLTRRKFLKRTGGATVGAIIATGALMQSVHAEEEEASSWCLVCQQEPAQGDWGEGFFDSIYSASGLDVAGLLLAQDRSVALVGGITNYYTQAHGSKCIRAGAPGRNQLANSSKVCVAGAYRATDAAGNSALFLPKHYVTLSVDRETGSISVSNSGAGYEDEGTLGGSDVKAMAKINVQGNGTKKVTLDYVCSFEWSGFQTSEVNVIKGWVGFSASVNNKVKWSTTGRLIIEAVEECDLQDKFAEYFENRQTDGNTWVDQGGVTRGENSPLAQYRYIDGGVNKGAHVNMGKLVKFITKHHTGSAKSTWEF
ncbi:twin-arginine translocation signal domain-containing protein [Roseibacillus ishigakijimensis]|uniref:Twin-arginine translocation signal domain-containing protein n=1 Tax=Roseibacillus ishigakijimensis TaxID=454146 RepID=A0A934RVB0_9BACT|nr:twin-arginine translocation signal domain-containing protein [Roseibacillus ishigakijimensis]MBK1835659.1 twin-arginine translocation signal domain-containing protein [Roseibacillus ishigakijimensis]